MHGFLCTLPVSPLCFTRFDVTLNGIPQSMTQATGINTQQLVGSFRDPGGQAHGFLCVLPVTSACFTHLDARDGMHTEILGFNDRGQLVGHFRDPTGLQHGFTTMAPGASHAQSSVPTTPTEFPRTRSFRSLSRNSSARPRDVSRFEHQSGSILF